MATLPAGFQVEQEQETLTDTGRLTGEGRPIFKNQFGDSVTERTITVTDPGINQGRPTNIPTVSGGKFLSDRDAINSIISAGGKDPITGRALQGFDSIDEAVTSAKSRSANLLTPVTLPKGFEIESQPKPDFSAVAQETGIGEALLIGAGRGLTTVGRGVERLTGLDIPGIKPTSPEEEAAFGALEKERPVSAFVGEIAGEAAPFLVGGLASVPAKLLPRLAASFGIGATEGATIAAGRGGTTQDIAGTAGLGGVFASAAELVLPVFGRVLGRALRKVTGKNIDEVIDSSGNISAEIKKTLDDAGVTVDQLQDEAVQTVRQAADTPEGLARLKAGFAAGETPEVAARATLFDDLGIPTTKSRLEQTPESFLSERQLARQVESKPAQALRERLAAESQGFKDVSEKLADDLGFGKDAGISIKEALDVRRTGEKAKVKALYDDLKVKSEGRGIPLAGNEVLDALKDDDVRGLVGRLPQSEIADLNDRLIEFGLDTDPERVADWVKARETRAGGTKTIPVFVSSSASLATTALTTTSRSCSTRP